MHIWCFWVHVVFVG